MFTRDGDDVEQPPHGLRADVTEPVLSHQQLGQVEGHLLWSGCAASAAAGTYPTVKPRVLSMHASLYWTLAIMDH